MELFHNLFGPNSLRLMAEVAACTAIIYAFLVVLMRFLGRHVLSQLSALDLLIVMLLGSSVETSMIHGSTLLRSGFVSATVLLMMNKLLTTGMLHSARLRNLVAGGPIVLVNRGQFIEESLIRAGLTHEDVLAAIRGRECGDLADVRLCVMEPDGEINVVTNAAPEAASS